MNTIKLVVGDWSKDGHNQSDDVYVECNLTNAELDKVLHQQKIIDLNQECREYEDSSLSPECTAKLLELKILDEESFEPHYKYKDRHSVCGSDAWVELLMSVVKHYLEPDVEFKYKIINTNSINVGGYGLFY